MLALPTDCADKVTFEQASSHAVVGFWFGLWHGTIAVIAFIVSLFSDSTAIYAIYNNGGWYNFGFIIRVGAISGGGSTTASTKKNRRLK